MYPAETKEMQYQINKKNKLVCTVTGMYSVHTGTYHFMNQKYVPGTYFKLKYVLQNIHFLSVRTGMYLVHTRYILEVKSMYLVHTWSKKYVQGTYLFMSVYSGTIL